jgi:hypothetical protein
LYRRIPLEFYGSLCESKSVNQLHGLH